MGIIRKALSVSTLGGVKYTSRREAETKERIANARLANAQAEHLAVDPVEARWAPVIRAIEAGETTWDQLPKLEKAGMPIRIMIRCKAAEKRHRELPGPGGYRP